MALNFTDMFGRSGNFLGDKKIVRKSVTISGYAFKPSWPQLDNVFYNGGYLDDRDGGASLVADVQLPHGATIIAAIVIGTGLTAVETWDLIRNLIDTDTESTVADEDVNTWDYTAGTSTRRVVDTDNYSYFFEVSGLSQYDRIIGAHVVYDIEEYSVIV